jgi:hypothetical protein
MAPSRRPPGVASAIVRISRSLQNGAEHSKEIFDSMQRDGYTKEVIARAFRDLEAMSVVQIDPTMRQQIEIFEKSDRIRRRRSS